MCRYVFILDIYNDNLVITIFIIDTNERTDNIRTYRSASQTIIELYFHVCSPPKRVQLRGPISIKYGA